MVLAESPPYTASSALYHAYSASSPFSTRQRVDCQTALDKHLINSESARPRCRCDNANEKNPSAQR